MSRHHDRQRPHRVRSHHWNGGILSVRIVSFDNFQDAEDYIKMLECHSAKIFDEEDILIAEYSVIFQSYA